LTEQGGPDVKRSTGWNVLRAAVSCTLCTLGALCVETLAAGSARACWECDEAACLRTEGGASACFYGVHGCTTFGSCGEGADDRVDADGTVALQLTWIEAEVPAAGPRVLRGAGRRVFGAGAARAFRTAFERADEPASVAAAVAAFGASFTVALRAGGADGVALAWTAESRGGRVTVRSLEHGTTGAPLADERLGESDVLLVPARFGGRACTLVIQPRVLARLAVRLESADLQRAARDAVRAGDVPLGIEVAALGD
jgi:hypothetical protein